MNMAELQPRNRASKHPGQRAELRGANRLLNNAPATIIKVTNNAVLTRSTGIMIYQCWDSNMFYRHVFVDMWPWWLTIINQQYHDCYYTNEWSQSSDWSPVVTCISNLGIPCPTHVRLPTGWGPTVKGACHRGMQNGDQPFVNDQLITNH